VPQETSSKAWMLYIDGSTINAGSGVGLIVVSSEGHSYKHALKFTFKTSNNEAEYEALLTGMELCNALGAVYERLSPTHSWW